MRESSGALTDEHSLRPTSRHKILIGAVATVTFLVMAGISLDNARQIFDLTLGEAVEAVAGGSAIRQIALLSYAGTAVVVMVAASSRPPSPKAIVAVPAGLLAAIALASPLWAIDPAMSVRRAVAFTLILVAAYASARLLTMREVTRLTASFAGIFVILAVGAQYLFGTVSPTDGAWRLAGIVHPVALSWYCGLGILASLAIARFEPAHRVPARWAAFAFLVCLLLTKTRTGLGAALAGVCVMWLLTSRRNIRRGVLVVATWLALGAFLAAVASGTDDITWSSLYAGTAEASSFGRADAVEQIATFTGRLPVWEATVRLAGDRPVLGYGFGAFESEEMIPIFADAAGWVPTSTHSGYLDVLLSLGLVGLAALVVTLATSTIASGRMAARDPTYAFGAAVLVWVSVNLVFEAPLLVQPIFTCYIVFLVIAKVGIFPDTQGPR